MIARALWPVAASLLAFTAIGAAQVPQWYPLPPESSRHGAAIVRARAAVAELIQAKRIPGFSIAVACDGLVVWSEGFGMANVELGSPVTPLTRFRIGSVSKVLTAAAVARLVEEGKLELDAPVQRYVPDFPVKRWPITTRQLAGHTAGIRHYNQDFSGPLKGAPHFRSVAQGLTLFQNDPLLFEPGTGYAYSSYGWNLVSAVVEGASQEEFLRYLYRSVLEPLGLRHTGADHNLAIVPHRSAFYMRDGNGTLLNAAYSDSSYKWAGGGLLSNAEDLVRFGSSLLQPGFFRQATLDLLFTSQRLVSGKETGTGIAWRSGKDPLGRRILHHGGSIDGGRAMLMMFPESKVAVAMLANIYVDFGERDAMQIGGFFIP